MKNAFLSRLMLLVVFWMCGFSLFSQDPAGYISGGVVNDAKLVHYVMDQKFPDYSQAVNEVFEKSKTFSNKSGSVLEVNLVVHVVWNTDFPEENIDDSVIYNQIDVLNADYSRLNADTVNLRSIFEPIAGAPHIHFNLEGIIRVETSETFAASFSGMPDNVKQTANGGSDAYDTDHYLNIWICRIQPFFGGALFGYAYPPAGLSNWPANSEAPSPELDGVVLDFRTIGANNPVGYPNPQGGGNIEFLGRTGVHEVGHFLGLRHIWGDGGGAFGGSSCGADDGCADTPNQGAQSSFDCNTSQNTCIDSVGGAPDPNDMPDLIENYMDYSSEACSNMFTLDQVVIMRNVLQNERSGLLNDVTSIKEEGSLSFRAFPNPVGDKLNIYSNSVFDGSEVIELRDMYGRVVKRLAQLQGKTISVDVSDLSAGVYLCNYRKGGENISEKIVVR